ncbi:hypothetical protein [Streptomyces bungoensis]|uniref:hypothetical protein n=1 Tax=Streptomyces bungoensis TaxID=285568 RepID=UPI00341B50EF
MPHTTLYELKGRLDWNLDDELRIAVGALDDASDLAATYDRDCPEDTAPRLVKTLTLKSAVRYLRNPNGYTQSRAGVESPARRSGSLAVLAPRKRARS